MAHGLNSRLNIQLVKSTIPFYPVSGGSITSFLDEVARMQQYVSDQIIIAPDYGAQHCEFDRTLGVPVTRIHYPHRIEGLGRYWIPVLPFTMLAFAWKSALKVKEIVDTSEDKVVVHAHGALYGILLSAILRLETPNTPVVVTQHSANPFKISVREGLATLAVITLLPFFKPAYLLVVDDGMGKKDYLKILRFARVRHGMILHSIDTEFFSPGNVMRPQEFTIISTSRLDAFKRVDLLIKAFARFRQMTATPSRLRIVGDGPERIALEDTVRTEGLEDCVEFEGNRQPVELRAMIRESSVIAGISPKSNVNRSILEGMACGRTPIVFDNGEEKAIISHMKDGILIARNDIEEFAAALKLLADNPEMLDRMGKLARNRVIEERNGISRITSILDAYRAVIQQ